MQKRSLANTPNREIKRGELIPSFAIIFFFFFRLWQSYEWHCPRISGPIMIFPPVQSETDLDFKSFNMTDNETPSGLDSKKRDILHPMTPVLSWFDCMPIQYGLSVWAECMQIQFRVKEFAHKWKTVNNGQHSNVTAGTCYSTKPMRIIHIVFTLSLAMLWPLISQAS